MCAATANFKRFKAIIMKPNKRTCEHCEYCIDGGLDFGEMCYVDGDYVQCYRTPTHYRECPYNSDEEISNILIKRSEEKKTIRRRSDLTI